MTNDSCCNLQQEFFIPGHHTGRLTVLNEIVDEPELINAYVAELDGIIHEGLVTMEKVGVIISRYGNVGGLK